MPGSWSLPPEWAPQSGVMLTWPHADTDWAAQLQAVEAVYCRLAREISAREGLLIVCRDAAHRRQVAARLTAVPGIHLERIVYGEAPCNDTWARDHGPLTVLDAEGRPHLLDFRFNGWGGKYAADLDDAITRRLHADGLFGEAALHSLPMILEGGSIEVDGAGALLTTAQCLLAHTRNPGLTQAEIESELKRLLGVNRVLWLHHGHLAGDDTDAHIDTLARFCGPDTIAYQACDDPDDEHYAPLGAMAEELAAFERPGGGRYRLVPLPLPSPCYDDDGRRLPAGYANFLIVNGAVLVPTYADPMDAVALERLGAAFPGREIVGIDCRALVRQNGSLHCVTMQLPAGLLPAARA